MDTVLTDALKSQFARAITTSKKPTDNDAVTVYGTVKISDNNDILVLIDGSSEYVPALSAIPFVKSDDRVTVTIQNHTYVITGNFSNDIVARSLTLTGDSSINLNDIFKVDAKGNMSATSGNFGPMHIETDDLGRMTLSCTWTYIGTTYKIELTANGVVVTKVDKDGTVEASVIDPHEISAKSVDGVKLYANHIPVYATTVNSQVVVDNLTIAANGSSSTSYEITPPDFRFPKPVQVCGWAIDNGSSSGNGAQVATIYKLYITSNGKLFLGVHNQSSSTIKVKITAYIQWSNEGN